MNAVISYLGTLAWGVGAWFIFLFCMLHAYFPINDEETSWGHRFVWWLLTIFFLSVWWELWR